MATAWNSWCTMTTLVRWDNFTYLPKQATCLAHKQAWRNIDGIYKIDPQNNGTGFNAYCDMTRDWWGWTLVLKTANGSTNAHRNTWSLNLSYVPLNDFNNTSKYSDSVINSIRWNYSSSIMKIEARDGKVDYFKENKAFNVNWHTNSINKVYNTYSNAVNNSWVCSWTHNWSYHTWLVWWNCYDYFLLWDNPWSRNRNYQAVKVWVK